MHNSNDQVSPFPSAGTPTWRACVLPQPHPCEHTHLAGCGLHFLSHDHYPHPLNVHLNKLHSASVSDSDPEPSLIAGKGNRASKALMLKLTTGANHLQAFR